MIAVILVGLMVAFALILAITWIEPRILGGPPAAQGTGHAVPRALEPVSREPATAPQAPARRAA